MKSKYIIGLILLLMVSSCKKSFLDKKPSSKILAPTTLADLKGLLESQRINITSGGLGQMAADEYLIIADQNYNALSVIQRNSYVWKQNLYEGENVQDWNLPFEQIFYANSVLDVLNKISFTDVKEAGAVKGWALFVRAYANYDLAKNFCKVYNPSSADVDLGIPIRRTPGVDAIEQRSNLKATFEQILTDLEEANNLLDPMVPPLNKNRPSKAAVMALKARVLLYMGDYANAELSADRTLQYHDKLIDFNGISTTSETPFSFNADEVIYQSTIVPAYSALICTGNRPDIEVNPILYNSFNQNDLRKSIYFLTNTVGRINIKRGYVGAGIYPFTGLATDEVYLIKAECLARRNETSMAMEWLNKLLIKRYKNTFPYIPLVANTQSEAIQLVLQERRKELIWKGLRWTDLKRLNRDGANIVLNRTINGINYTLPPNDSRYVFPIPDQEILASGIQQN